MLKSHLINQIEDTWRHGDEDERAEVEEEGDGWRPDRHERKTEKCDRREKGHWEIERVYIYVRVRVLTWLKRDSWRELDPDKDRK